MIPSVGSSQPEVARSSSSAFASAKPSGARVKRVLRGGALLSSDVD
jgi:hypothetical protein